MHLDHSIGFVDWKKEIKKKDLTRSFRELLMACPEQMMRLVLTSFSICLWNAFMCILSFWNSVVLALVSLKSLPLFYLFQWGNCSPLSLSVVCDFRLSRCFPSTLSSFAERTFSGVMPLLSVARFTPWREGELCSGFSGSLSQMFWHQNFDWRVGCH